MSALPLAKATAGPAAILGAALGESMGRVVANLEQGAATLRVSSSDTSVGFLMPPAHETEPLRECLPGTPSAAFMVALGAVESALMGPDADEALVEDALRRCASLSYPANRRHERGALLAPSAALLETVTAFGRGTHPLSCGSATPDAGLLLAGACLGAVGTSMHRATLVLRGLTRDPVTLCSAAALGELVRRCCAGDVTADAVVHDARAAEETALGCVRALPGTLAGPAEMGHGALAMSLARARASLSGDDALLPLGRDVSTSPEVVLASALGCVMVEPAQVLRHVAVIMRAGNTANVAAGTLLALVGALQGLKIVPLGWLGQVRGASQLLAFAEAAAGKRKGARLLCPAADLCWQWYRDEMAFRQQRAAERAEAPPPVRTEQMSLFDGSRREK